MLALGFIGGLASVVLELLGAFLVIPVFARLLVAIHPWMAGLNCRYCCCCYSSGSYYLGRGRFTWFEGPSEESVAKLSFAIGCFW
jgi:hypothetical protein